MSSVRLLVRIHSKSTIYNIFSGVEAVVILRVLRNTQQATMTVIGGGGEQKQEKRSRKKIDVVKKK